MTRKYDPETIKADTDIADFISGYVDDLKKNGREYEACCPFHNERTPSFKVIPEKSFAYCHGCGWGGDVIDFFRDMHGCTFQEACEALGGKQSSMEKAVKRRDPIDKSKKADYYDSYSPLSTDQRIKLGDSVNIKNPKRDGTIWEGAKPSMVFHYGDGMYVLRFEIGGKKLTPQVRWCQHGDWQGWTMYPFPEPRPLYGLAELVDQPDRQVMIVEGEKARDVAHQLLDRKLVVISWCGGGGGITRTDWSPLKGRKVVIVPDNDEPGFKAARQITDQLSQVDVDSIKYVIPPATLPKGWDIADGEWSDGKEMLEWCRRNIGDLPEEDVEEEPPPYLSDIPLPEDEYGTPDNEPPPDAPGMDDDVIMDMPFRILGHYKGNRFYLPNSTQQIIELAPSQHSKNNLLALAPMHKWLNASWDISTKSGMDAAVNGLLQMSSQAGMFNIDRLRGRGAWLDRGRALVHMGQTVFVDGMPQKPERVESDYIYQQDIDLGIHLTEPAGNAEANQLVQICKRLSWENPLSAVLLAGWCVIAPLTGILPWRPHIWVTGPSGAGKSTVLKSIIATMLGDIAIKVEGKTTEAGIRQQLGLDARPVLFDEAEAEDKQSIDRLKSILDFARVCSSGGTVIKGSTNGSSMAFSAHASFCFSSINTSVKHFADESRISQLVLKRDFTTPSTYYEQLERDIFEIITPEFADRMFSRSVKNMALIQENCKIFVEAANIHFKSRRIADQVGVLLAGAYLCHSTKTIDRDAALKWIAAHDWNDHTAAGAKSDSDRLFSRILTFKIKIQGKERTVEASIGEAIMGVYSQMSDLHAYQAECDQELRRIGILVDIDTVHIANNSDPLRVLLTGTPWEASWHRALAEIPGAEKSNTKYFSPGIKCRCVSIPINLLTDIKE